VYKGKEEEGVTELVSSLMQDRIQLSLRCQLPSCAFIWYMRIPLEISAMYRLEFWFFCS